MKVDDKDKALLALLSANSRESTAELARRLKLSRSTVKDRIARLEKQGVITGYTLRFSDDYSDAQILAHVMIQSDAKHSAQVVRKLRAMSSLKSLYAVNGQFDLIAVVSSASTRLLDQALDEIGAIEGVEKTVSSIILSTKFER